MMVFIINGKTTCFGLQLPFSGSDNFLAKTVLYNKPKPRGDVEISSLILRAFVKLNWWDVIGLLGSCVWMWMWILLVG